MGLHETARRSRQVEVEAELASAGVQVVVDPKRAAEALGLGCAKTVQRMVLRGDLVAFRVGKHVKIRRAELARYIVVNEK